MEKDKVSVIVAIYNVERFLEKCITSIIRQDYDNIEIILVDDKSTDTSGKICDSFAERDDRIIVIHHKENTRQSGVRNDGIKAASGEFIVFVDGDDWIAPDYVSYLHKVITKENGVDFGINLVNYTTRDMKDEPEREVVFWTPERATVELLWPRIAIGAWNKIYRKNFLEKNNLYFKPLFTAEGFRFISDVSQRVDRVAVGCKRVYYYRRNNAESATTKYDIRQSMTAIHAVEGIEKDLIIKTEPVIRAVEQHKLFNHFWNVRQILALGKKELYQKEYIESRRFLRKNVIRIASYVEGPKTKIFILLLGIIPDILARRANRKEEEALQKDVVK